MSSLKNKTIGVLMGGLSPERDVSLVSGKAVFEAIKSQGLKAVIIDVGRDIVKQLEAARIDLAFIALHGTYGEDGAIQGILEYMGIPYTGAGVLGSALAFDKVISKALFVQNSIPTAEYQVFHRDQQAATKRTLALPVAVKPSNQGSSIGVTIVHNESEWRPALDLAFRYSEEAVVERFIDGRQVTIGMRGEQPLPIVHINPKSGFYDYASKYTAGRTEYICPAELSAEEERLCRAAAVKTFRALKGRGFPRVDAIIDNQGRPWILELNTIPGMTPTSLLPKAAKQAGLGFEDLVREILQTARLDNEEQNRL